MVLGPGADEVADVACADFAHDVALEADVAGVAALGVGEAVETVEGEEGEEAGGEDLVFVALALGVVVLRPEFGRSRNVHQSFEVSFLMPQLHPVAEIFAGASAVVAPGGEPFGKPDGVDVGEAEGELGAFAAAGIVEVGDVVEGADELRDFAVFGFAHLVALGVEPEGWEAHGLAAEGVALSRADEGFVEFLGGEGSAVVGGVGEELLFAAGVEGSVELAELFEAVDVGARFDAVGGVGESVLLLGVEGLVDLVEHGFGLPLGLGHPAAAHEDGIVFGGVFLFDLPVFDVAHPLCGVPSEGFGMLALHLGAKHGQDALGDALEQSEDAALAWLVGGGWAGFDDGAVDLAVELVAHAEEGGHLHYGLGEAHAFLAHDDVDGGEGFGVVAVVAHSPAGCFRTGTRGVEMGRWGFLRRAEGAKGSLLVAHALAGFGEVVEDDVEPLAGGLIEFFETHHIYIAS